MARKNADQGAIKEKAVDESYKIRRPGRPKKSESSHKEEASEEKGKSLRFEMRLPPGIVRDLELMQKQTGSTFAEYIRRVILRALEEDRNGWGKSNAVE